MRLSRPWLSFTEGYTENEGKEKKTSASGVSSADGSLHMLLSVLLRRLRNRDGPDEDCHRRDREGAMVSACWWRWNGRWPTRRDKQDGNK